MVLGKNIVVNRLGLRTEMWGQICNSLTRDSVYSGTWMVIRAQINDNIKDKMT